MNVKNSELTRKIFLVALYLAGITGIVASGGGGGIVSDISDTDVTIGTSSEEIATDEIHADIEETPRSVSEIRVKATFTMGSLIDYVIISGDDYLEATIDGISREMTKRNSSSSFQTTFEDLENSGSKEVSIRLARGDGSEATSTITTPPFIEILTPAEGSNYDVADVDMIELSWTPPSDATEPVINIPFTCEFTQGTIISEEGVIRSISDPVSGSWSESSDSIMLDFIIASNLIDEAILLDDSSVAENSLSFCSADLVLTIKTEGQLSDEFADGNIDSEIDSEVSITFNSQE